MSEAETFTLLPITINETSKSIDPHPSFNPSTIPGLPDDLSYLNTLHRSLLQFDHAIPPPPVPVQPTRTVNITKLRESGNAAFRKANYTEALKMYTHALDMATNRPHWEPSQLIREECALLFSNRSQAFVALRRWAEGFGDAEMSVQCKSGGNSKAWYRGALCLKEMGDLERAREYLEVGIEWEGMGRGNSSSNNQQADGDVELKGLLKEVEAELERGEAL